MNTKPVSNNEIARFVVWLQAWHIALCNVFGVAGQDEEVLKGAMKLAPWKSKEGV